MSEITIRLVRIAVILALVLATCLYLPTAAQAKTWQNEVEAIVGDNPNLTRVIVHCIKYESGGNPNARLGQHVGLLQFNDDWGSESKRLDPIWSIERIVRVYDSQGFRGIYKHWCRWHGCGGYALRFTSDNHSGRERVESKRERGSTGTPSLSRISSRLLKRDTERESGLRNISETSTVEWLAGLHSGNLLYRPAFVDAGMEPTARCKACHVMLIELERR